VLTDSGECARGSIDEGGHLCNSCADISDANKRIMSLSQNWHKERLKAKKLSKNKHLKRWRPLGGCDSWDLTFSYFSL